jgi:hypothetical protein
MPRLEFLPVSYATPTAREAVTLVAELWTYNRLTQHCRDAVRYCLSLGVSRSDIAFHIRFSVYMSHAMTTKNKSHDPLYKFIYQRIANIAKACGWKKSGTIVQPADGVGKPKGNRIEGVTAKSKSATCAPLKERDLNKLGVLEEGLKKAEVQTFDDVSPRQDGAIPPTQESSDRPSESSAMVNRTDAEFPSRIEHPDVPVRLVNQAGMHPFYRINRSYSNENACAEIARLLFGVG